MPDLAQVELEARAALRSDERTRVLADAAFEVAPGGLSNHAWFADSTSGRYFVRLSPADASRLGVDRVGECRLLSAVAGAGLAPALVRCDPLRRLLVTLRVGDGPLSRATAIEPHRVRRLGQALRTLHALPVPAGVPRVDFAAQAKRLESLCVATTAGDSLLRSRAKAAFGRLAQDGRPFALCHNDLHHLNLVDDGRLWIVDWEYGGVGDPVFDLASFLCQHDCGSREVDSLLGAYGEDAIDPALVRAACWAFDYVQWLWYRAWPSGEGSNPVYAERAAALERRLHSLCPV